VNMFIDGHEMGEAPGSVGFSPKRSMLLWSKGATDGGFGGLQG